MTIKDKFCLKNKWWIGILVFIVCGLGICLTMGFYFFKGRNPSTYTAVPIFDLDTPIVSTVVKDKPRYFYWLVNKNQGGCAGHLTFTGSIQNLTTSTGFLSITSSSQYPPLFLNVTPNTHSKIHYNGCCWDSVYNPLFWGVMTTSEEEQMFNMIVNFDYAVPSPQCGLDVGYDVIVIWLIVSVVLCGILMFCVIWIFVACVEDFGHVDYHITS